MSPRPHRASRATSCIPSRFLRCTLSLISLRIRQRVGECLLALTWTREARSVWGDLCVAMLARRAVLALRRSWNPAASLVVPGASARFSRGAHSGGGDPPKPSGEDSPREGDEFEAKDGEGEEELFSAENTRYVCGNRALFSATLPSQGGGLPAE